MDAWLAAPANPNKAPAENGTSEARAKKAGRGPRTFAGFPAPRSPPTSVDTCHPEPSQGSEISSQACPGPNQSGPRPDVMDRAGQGPRHDRAARVSTHDACIKVYLVLASIIPPWPVRTERFPLRLPPSQVSAAKRADSQGIVEHSPSSPRLRPIGIPRAAFARRETLRLLSVTEPNHGRRGPLGVLIIRAV
jgi:hypothetical protein